MSNIKERRQDKGYKGIRMSAFLLAMVMMSAAAAAPALPAARQAEIVQLVRHDCGSCHGLTLKGGLGPALTRDALAGKAPEGLRATILNGRPGTPMPPWRTFFAEDEVAWIVEMLLQGGFDAEK